MRARCAHLWEGVEEREEGLRVEAEELASLVGDIVDVTRRVRKHVLRDERARLVGRIEESRRAMGMKVAEGVQLAALEEVEVAAALPLVDDDLLGLAHDGP